jgi:hypothetical protein
LYHELCLERIGRERGTEEATDCAAAMASEHDEIALPVEHSPGFYSEFAGILQLEIRQQVSGVGMFIATFCEGEYAISLVTRPMSKSAL